MKNTLFGCFAVALIMIAGSATAQSEAPAQTATKAQAQASIEKKDAAPSPFAGKVKFDKETIDFGNTKLNNPVTVQFEFTNVSPKPLIIESAQPSCGCTTPDWTKSPVLPGKKGIIKATYNAGSLGHQSKTVFVNFKGIDPTLELHLKGNVVK